MKEVLPGGIPLTRDYMELIESDAFKAMEQYSDRFLSDSKIILKNYMRKWVADPLHQWSRQWEYPFAYSLIQQMATRKPKIKVLDAGSGVTFFPYLLGEKFDGMSIHCCDYDKKLTNLFEQINEGKNKAVEFVPADLRSLPYDDESFDIIYCISVLEHTNDYEKIINQFYRILKPGGMLIVTFDISLDGTRDIPTDKANSFLASLARPFEANDGLSFDLDAEVSNPEIFTTVAANNINSGLLPWHAPSFIYRIKSFLTTGRFGSWPPSLTVYCVSLTKRPT